MTGRFRNWLDDRLNNLKIKKKLFLLYFYCMMLPLVLTDAVIIGLIVKREYDTKQETSRGIVSAVKYSLNSAAAETVTLSKNIYFNKYINEFLNTEFQSTLDYYNQYQELLKDSLFDSSLGTSNSIIRMYADNGTIVNGDASGVWNLWKRKNGIGILWIPDRTCRCIFTMRMQGRPTQVR